GGGTVTNNPPNGPYLINSSVTLTALTNSGWTFMNWAGDLTNATAVTAVTMTTSKTVTAVFGTPIITTTSGQNSGCAVVLNPAATLNAYGSVVRCSAVPSSGLFLTDWGGAVNAWTGNPLNFTVTNAGPTINANFGTLAANKFSLAVL